MHKGDLVTDGFGKIHQIESVSGGEYTLDNGEKIPVQAVFPLDLSILLKGHEGEKLWSPVFGECEFLEIHTRNGGGRTMIKVRLQNGNCRNLTPTGRLDYDLENLGDCILFPSQESQDWRIWKMNHIPVIKTWSDIVNNGLDPGFETLSHRFVDPSLLRSAKAYLKIRYLIKLGYSKEEPGVVNIQGTNFYFPTEELKYEFLSHHENQELLKSYTNGV